jgi:tetrahydromethanopterin:alpha-L-glutamate ligase
VTAPPLRKIGILGSAQGPYVQKIVAAAQRRQPSLDCHILSFSDLTVSLAAQPIATSPARVVPAPATQASVQVLTSTSAATALPTGLGQRNREQHNLAQTDLHEPRLGQLDLGQLDLGQLDALLVRSMPLGSLEQVIFRMDALQVLESLGVPVINPPRALEIAIDKWLTLHRLQQAGVPTPATVACQTRSAALEAFELFGGDVVVKPLFGGEGRGLLRVDDQDLAWRVFSTLEQLRSVLYVQPFLPNFGYDIRVLLVGDEMLSVKRIAPAGMWRTNISQGSTAQPHALTESERRLAESAAAAVGGSFLGVDLLPTRSGECVVLEVNAVPGWSGTQSALGVDVADLLLAHIEKLHVNRHSNADH